MLRRLASSTVARLIAAIFVLQVISGGAAIVLLRAKMLQVINSDRTRQIVDLRNDLLSAYYDGGYRELAAFVAERRGSAAEPLIFVAVSGHGAPVLSHLAEVPKVAASERPVRVRAFHASGGPPSEALALASDLADGTHLVVGTLTTPDRRFDLAFAEALALVVVLTALLALAGALLTGLVVSRRAHAIAETAEALAAGNFSARVEGSGFGDGFDHLGNQINLMAERIDQLVSELQSVAGGLAHDLRSPVARLRAAIETAQASLTERAAAEALQLAQSDAEVLEAMLAAALELARLESGAMPDRRQQLDLLDLVTDLAELYEPLAEQSGVTLAASGQAAMILGDRELLSRALANLIDNALKYGGTAIAVRTVIDDGMVLLEVEDDGPGIADADRERAMVRFTRLDNARTRPGAGLGLATVAAIARLHGGTFELASGQDAGPGRGRGLIARLRLPRA
ncbi:sensor histidine kinase [Novosphingobium aerophilum]|uniref:histidine kinase n=1 Tax=Novosphingobium aerophilum TaxID=2839843 RepID=A0A7X1F7E6_9SPHN|nr:HAMP domain-containing sensor histidine kinase [Novosphingobium aerophilum]MBC2651743.1 HAMP domain-containing histidine kinase [Novosphingobium aerophilum]